MSNARQPDYQPIVAIVVAYNSEDVIDDCIGSLLAQSAVRMRIIIVDNASTDRTVERVRQMATAQGMDFKLQTGPDMNDSEDLPQILLIRAEENRGFAAGCNIGLVAARRRTDAALFWLLNPDCQADPNCAAAYLATAKQKPEFGLMGGRTLFSKDNQTIQSDGGKMSKWTAVCQNVNQGLQADNVPPPDVESLTFLSGANLVASRAFVDAVGPMPEEYFLYYEEVAWALKRKSMPMVLCPDAKVFHLGGTAAGSGTLGRAPSAFSNYFNYRNRLRLARRHCPRALPGAYVYSILKIIHLALSGARSEAWGAFLGLHQLQPTKEIQNQLGPRATRIATGR